MNPHESDNLHSRVLTDHRVRRVMDDLRQAITRAEEELAYAEREVDRLNDELSTLEYLYRMSGLATTVTMTDTSGYSHAPGYMESTNE